MKGYWNLPDETAAAISPDGWFATGDIGTRRRPTATSPSWTARRT